MQTTSSSPHDPVGWHGTTILCVRRFGTVAMAGDGQVTLGATVIKGNARKVRRIGAGGTVLAGFAGATADAFTPTSWNAPASNWRKTGGPIATCAGWKP